MATTFLTMGGGGFSMNDGASAFDRYLLEISGVANPTVCFIGTASGDAAGYIEKFTDAFDSLGVTSSYLSLFQRDAKPIAEHMDEADIVYVGGGSTYNLLALWRLHGLDQVLKDRMAARPVVLSGISAGALCWYEGGITDSFGPVYQPMADGLGFLPGSASPHFDGEATRRPVYFEAVRSGVLGNGHAIDDYAAVEWRDGELVGCVAEQPNRGVSYLRLDGDVVNEERLPVRLLTS